MKTILGAAATVALLAWGAAPSYAATLCSGVSGAGVTQMACTDAVGGIYKIDGNANGNDFPGEVEENIEITDSNPATKNNVGTVVSQPGVVVHFDSDDAVRAANGNAQIGLGNDTFNVLDVTFDDANGKELLFGDFGFDTAFAKDNDQILIEGLFNGSALISLFIDSFSSAGQDGWMVLALGDTLFDSVRITSQGGAQLKGFQSGKHFEVSRLGALVPNPGCFPNCPPNPVPLPAGIWLFGTAIAGMGALRLRRRRTSALA